LIPTPRITARRAIVDIEPQVFDLLEYLIDNRSASSARMTCWPDLERPRGVRIDPRSRIAALRAPIGDTATAGVIRTIARKGFRFVGDVHETGATAVPGRCAAAPRAPDTTRPPTGHSSRSWLPLSPVR
jgi:DNA-binding winged helix-turn-helix (wHTH) protein